MQTKVVSRICSKSVAVQFLCRQSLVCGKYALIYNSRFLQTNATVGRNETYVLVSAQFKVIWQSPMKFTVSRSIYPNNKYHPATFQLEIGFPSLNYPQLLYINHIDNLCSLFISSISGRRLLSGISMHWIQSTVGNPHASHIHRWRNSQFFVTVSWAFDSPFDSSSFWPAPASSFQIHNKRWKTSPSNRLRWHIGSDQSESIANDNRSGIK